MRGRISYEIQQGEGKGGKKVFKGEGEKGMLEGEVTCEFIVKVYKSKGFFLILTQCEPCSSKELQNSGTIAVLMVYW